MSRLGGLTKLLFAERSRAPPGARRPTLIPEPCQISLRSGTRDCFLRVADVLIHSVAVHLLEPRTFLPSVCCDQTRRPPAARPSVCTHQRTLRLQRHYGFAAEGSSLFSALRRTRVNAQNFHAQIQTILTQYIELEEYYIIQSIHRAIREDVGRTAQAGAQVSPMARSCSFWHCLLTRVSLGRYRVLRSAKVLLTCKQLALHQHALHDAHDR